jgi:hypothetical protein
MEFRWLTPEEQRTRAVETASLAEVLTLAQKLQAEGEARVSDEQVVEMGRELGIRPEFVREALHLRRGAARPALQRTEAMVPEPVSSARPGNGTLARALCVGLGLGTLPMALIALAETNAQPVTLFALFATLAAGWSARHPRQAATAGAVIAPLIVLMSMVFVETLHSPGLSASGFWFSLISFTPLGAAVGQLAASWRRRLEQQGEERPPLPISGR